MTCSRCSRPVDLFDDPHSQFPGGITIKDANGTPTGQRWLGWYIYLDTIFCGFCWLNTGTAQLAALEQYR